jgi:Ran GTPase-activating protein (RanGAP) involved in mRNA processing and transport
MITQLFYRAFTKCLEQNPRLEFVNLRRCDLPADGCLPIAASLPSCANLRFLWLDYNSVSDRGAERLAANLANCSLAGLSLTHNPIWSGSTTLLLKAMTGTTRLTTIDLSGNIIDLALLSQCPRQTLALTGLSISRCEVNEAQVPFFWKNCRTAS